MRIGALCGFLLLAMCDVAVADEKVWFNEEGYGAHKIVAYNQAVGALPLDPKDGNQVRVWFDDVMGGRITGFIVARKGVWRCRLRVTNDNGEYIVVHRGECSGPRKYPERIERVMALMGDAAKLEVEEKLHCDVMDGWQASVEGMFEGQRFAFDASNTDECSDTNPAAARADRFLDMVAAAWQKKDED